MSFIVALVVWFFFNCAFIKYNMSLLKKSFCKERGDDMSRHRSIHCILLVVALFLTLFSIAYAIGISSQIYDYTVYEDQYEEDRQKKLKQLHYKFYQTKISDDEKNIYGKLTLNYSASRYQPWCTIDDYENYDDSIISDVLLSDERNI